MTAAVLFNPSPTLADALLAALADPSTSLTQLAAAQNTSLEALSLWITRPDIAERLEAIHHIAAVRTRFIAANLLPQSLAALDRVVKQTTLHLTASDAAAPSEKLSPDQRHRILESSRRAASKIISLANFNPLPLFAKPTRPMARFFRPTSSPSNSTPAQQPAPPSAPSPSSNEPRASASGSNPSQLPNLPATPTPSSHQPPPTPPSRPPTQPRPLPNPPQRFARQTPNLISSLAARAGTPTALLNRPHEHWP